MRSNAKADLLKDVSRETCEALQHYVSMIEKWNPRINLVAKSTLPVIWERHVQDSIQIFDFADETHSSWADLGSGGGFPGVVVAILAAQRNPPLKVTLVESDQRKSTFLRQVFREVGVSATVLSERIEALPGLDASVVSARALADLSTLFGYAQRHLKPGGTALFFKGANWKKELSAARASWSFSLTEHKSQTDPNAVILQIGDLSHV